MGPRTRGARSFFAKGLVAALTTLACLALTEYGLRAYRSLTRDGTFHLASSSMHVRPHEKYGWFSPRAMRYTRNDPCYGRGVVTYNEEGFRARPRSEARGSDLVVCVLGDSTMQGYQVPDGDYLPHLLERELRKDYRRPYVLPLAVGGYGTVQEWMLFEDFCRPLNPAAVVFHWSSNDVTNNSFLAERYTGSRRNNARPRPYYEDGRVVVRRPYPLRLSDRLDETLLVRSINTLLLDREGGPEPPGAIEEGWRVAQRLVAEIARSAPVRVALLDARDRRATALFEAQGFRIAAHGPLPPGSQCLPRDDHPNGRGHRFLLEALLPVLREALREHAIRASAP